jgi:DNA-binding MarR family transcriptional regulator
MNDIQSISGPDLLVNKCIINKLTLKLLIIDRHCNIVAQRIVTIHTLLKTMNEKTKTSYVSDLTFDEKVMMAIVRAAENFKRAHSSIFKKLGLSFPQYNILRVLDASENGRNKTSAVSRIMLVPGANMTGLSKRLEKDGFILRKRDPQDERVTLLAITRKGRDALKMIEDEKNESIKILLSGFTQEEKHDLLDKIKKLIKSTSAI